MADKVPESVLSHWSMLVENLQASPLSFYQAVETALLRRQIPATENSRVDYKEGGLLSAQREYLHVRKESLVFDICAAPFGTGFFFSWWFADDRPKLNPLLQALALVALFSVAGRLLLSLGIAAGTIVLVAGILLPMAYANEQASQGKFDDNLIRSLPLLGRLYESLFKPGTYYRIDSLEMFQKAVHNAVLEVIDQMTTEKGLRALSESERKPVMHQFYERTGR
jgi:hypothetical protein